MAEIQVPITPWNIFDKSYYKDESTTQYEYAEYKERNVSVTNLTEYNMINQDLDIPLLLCDSFLQVKCRILDSTTNTTFVRAADIAFNNNGFNIFQRAQYYMNDQLIEDLDEVGVSTLTKSLIEYSKSYSESACNELWEIDNGLGGSNTSTSFSDFHTLYAVGANGCVYDILTVGANGVISLTRRNFVGNAAHVDNQAVRLYVDGIEVKVEKFRGTANQVVLNLALTVNNALALIITGAAQYDVYKLIRIDGAEVFLFTVTPPAQIPVLTYFSAPLAGNAILTTTTENGPGNVAPVAATQNDVITCRVISSTNKYFNKGYYERKYRTLDNDTGTIPNKYLNLFLPIRRLFKIFDYNQHVFRGIKHTIRLYKNLNDKTLFMKGLDTNNGTLEISDISWWVPTLRPSIEYGLKLDKELNSGMTTKLQWNQLRCYPSPEFTSNTGVNAEAQWRITSAGNKPIKVFIVFRTSRQYANGGDQSAANPMLFKHMNITNINLRINSMQFPKEEFRCDFTLNDDWVRVYMQYLQVSGKTFDTEGGGFSICYDEFSTLYPIFCFDLSKQDPQIWANVTQAELELRYRRSAEYAAPDNTNFRIYAIIEFEKSIQLNGADNRLRVVL